MVIKNGWRRGGEALTLHFVTSVLLEFPNHIYDLPPLKKKKRLSDYFFLYCIKIKKCFQICCL